jgi:hypothetical protein
MLSFDTQRLHLTGRALGHLDTCRTVRYDVGDARTAHCDAPALLSSALPRKPDARARTLHTEDHCAMRSARCALKQARHEILLPCIVGPRKVRIGAERM